MSKVEKFYITCERPGGKRLCLVDSQTGFSWTNGVDRAALFPFDTARRVHAEQKVPPGCSPARIIQA